MGKIGILYEFGSALKKIHLLTGPKGNSMFCGPETVGVLPDIIDILLYTKSQRNDKIKRSRE